MLTLRHPSFVMLEAHKRLYKAGVYAGLGMASLTVTRYAPPSLGMVAAVAAAGSGLVVWRRVREAWPMWRGHRGEVLVVRLLSQLDERHVCLTNYSPPGAKQGDIDVVVAGPFGVLVLEVKSHSQPVRCIGEKWSALKADGSWRAIKSASEQAQRNAKRVAKLIKAPVFPLVVIGNWVPLQATDPAVPIVRRSELLEYIARLNDEGFDANLLASELSIT